jgi:hypothetical protein
VTTSLGEPCGDINITQSGEKRGISAIQVRGKVVEGIFAQLSRSIWEKRLTSKHFRQANPASIGKINAGAAS